MLHRERLPISATSDTHPPAKPPATTGTYRPTGGAESASASAMSPSLMGRAAVEIWSRSETGIVSGSEGGRACANWEARSNAPTARKPSRRAQRKSIRNRWIQVIGNPNCPYLWIAVRGASTCAAPESCTWMIAAWAGAGDEKEMTAAALMATAMLAAEAGATSGPFSGAIPAPVLSPCRQIVDDYSEQLNT